MFQDYKIDAECLSLHEGDAKETTDVPPVWLKGALLYSGICISHHARFCFETGKDI